MPDQTYFYSPVTVKCGEEFLVDTDEFNHIVKSLRKSVGDEIDFVNGFGQIIHAEITAIQNHQLQCRAIRIEREQNELPVRVTAGVSLIKQQRFEWMVEKLTELGVYHIQPLITDRVVHTSFRVRRLEKKIIAAMKQSERAVLPKLHDPIKFHEWFDSIKTELTFVATQSESASGLDSLQNTFAGEMMFVIGPEGGWSNAELDFLNKKQTHTFSLGQRRLRTETAAIATMAEIRSLSEQHSNKRKEIL